MKRIVGVRFKKAGRVYYFHPGELDIQAEDGVIVETSRGIEYADVALTPRDLPDEQVVAPLKNVLRIATQEDHETHERNAQLEEEAFEVCQQKIAEHGLEMKLVDVEYTFNGSKITFFFTSEGRVDFRDLVKDLAFVFKTRIELRQIGVRDEAKMLGGLGSCGRPVCCKTFLADFQPVSIKMAKEQKLSLSPTKISGLCGRLMCCLKYEQDAYESMRKQMPKTGREVLTADGKGLVLENNVITEKTKVKLVLPDGTVDVREYHFSEVCKPGTPEEEAQQQKELIRKAQERAIKERPVEEEFRFITGAVREARPEVPAGEPQAEVVEQQEKPKRPRRRRSRSSGGGDQPQGGSQPQGNNQPQGGSQPQGSDQPQGGNRSQGGSRSQGGNRPQGGGQSQGQAKGQRKPPQKQEGAQGGQGGQSGQGGEGAPKRKRSHRGGRNRRPKPAGAAGQQPKPE